MIILLQLLHEQSTELYYKSTNTMQSLDYNFLFANDKGGENYTHGDAYTQGE